MGRNLANEYGIQFFQTSAKSNIGVSDCFEAIATDVKNRLMKDGGPAAAPKRRLDARQQQSGTKEGGGGCCK